jgi:hypothetical protein
MVSGRRGDNLRTRLSACHAVPALNSLTSEGLTLMQPWVQPLHTGATGPRLVSWGPPGPKAVSCREVRPSQDAYNKYNAGFGCPSE